jgi:tetratricopeptide (TPR) repeat protein
MTSRSARRKKQRADKAAAPAAPAAAAAPSYAPHCALLVVGVFLLYLGSYHYPLVFDDKLLNPVQLPEMSGACLGLNNRCLTYTTWGLTWLAFGLDLFWFRVGNVLLHALAALALYFFLDQLFEAVRRQSPQSAGDDLRARNRLLAFCGAALFAAHPATVYGVAYLVQRGTVMATLFGLLSLTAFTRALAEQDRRWLWLAALSYIAAVLSKEHVIMLPAVAFAIALLLGKRVFGSWLERLLLASAVIIVAAVIINRLTGIIGTVPEYFTRELGEIKATGESTFDPRQAYFGSVVTQTVLYFKYLLLWLVPYPGWMSVDLRASIANGPFEWPWVLGVPAFLAWGAAAGILILRRGAVGLLGLAMAFPWFLFFTEFVTSRIQEPVVLYRSYLWMAGLPIALPLLARRLSARAIVIGCAVIALAFGVAARERLATFENNLKLWDDVVRKNTDLTQIFVDRGYSNRAVALLREGRLDAALSDLEMTIKLNPRSSHAYVNRATVLRQQGHDPRALADLERAIELDPAFAEAHSEHCALLLKLNDLARALPSCNEALRLAPQLPIALINRAVIYSRTRRFEEALVDLDEFLKYEPKNGIARFNRAMIYRELGRPLDSETDLRTSCGAGFGPACEQLKSQPLKPPPLPPLLGK